MPPIADNYTANPRNEHGKPYHSLRMQQAQLLLFQTELQVAEIGERVGYPDLFHFSKTFKQAFGVSPSEYRRETRRGVQEGRDGVVRKIQASSGLRLG